jgi:hypothetical protein
MRSTGGLSNAGAQHGKRDELKTDAEYMVAVAMFSSVRTVPSPGVSAHPPQKGAMRLTVTYAACQQHQGTVHSVHPVDLTYL